MCNIFGSSIIRKNENDINVLKMLYFFILDVWKSNRIGKLVF